MINNKTNWIINNIKTEFQLTSNHSNSLCQIPWFIRIVSSYQRQFISKLLTRKNG